MRILKCYLALDAVGHYVTASEAVSGCKVWSCVSCDCALILHAGSAQEPAWFEHDQRTVARKQLMDCVYLDPGVKADEKRRSLQTMLETMSVTSPVRFWHCIWCDGHFEGDKLCTQCGTGIYSTEDVSQRC
jgi:hypothetical protein